MPGEKHGGHCQPGHKVDTSDAARNLESSLTEAAKAAGVYVDETGKMRERAK
ncbi:hypothetical protein [Pseudomonas linyingensis]|nr:hypothetical protein [Pseudomonas linyingensis]